MSNGFQSSEHIRRPVEEVWAVLTDWKQAPLWMNGIDEMRGPDPPSAAEGATVHFRARGAERESTVAAWSPPAAPSAALAARRGHGNVRIHMRARRRRHSRDVASDLRDAGPRPLTLQPHRGKAQEPKWRSRLPQATRLSVSFWAPFLRPRWSVRLA